MVIDDRVAATFLTVTPWGVASAAVAGGDGDSGVGSDTAGGQQSTGGDACGRGIFAPGDAVGQGCGGAVAVIGRACVLGTAVLIKLVQAADGNRR